MSEKHLMLCNLIAWKEGDGYVFEDGSKAYPYSDNDKRFNKFMLIPDWVVRGLEDTPFNYFGFKTGKIHIRQLGVFTREEFEREIIKYKYKELNKYVGKVVRLEDGSEVILESYKGYKYKLGKATRNNCIWIHVKDVVNNRNALCSYGTELVSCTGEVYKRMSVPISGSEERSKYTVFIDNEVRLLHPGTLGLSAGKGCNNIYPIVSEYMYTGRVLYYNGVRRCIIRNVENAMQGSSTKKSAGAFTIEFLDTGEMTKIFASSIFNFVDETHGSMVKKSASMKWRENNYIIKGRWTDCVVIDTIFDAESRVTYKVVEFCDGSYASIPSDFVRRGRFCHSDVFEAWKSSIDVAIKSYTYKNDNWIVESNIGTFERTEFIKEVHKIQLFKETCVGKMFITRTGCKYTIESMEEGKSCTYLHIRFEDGLYRLYSLIKVYNGEVYHSYDESCVSHKSDYQVDGIKKEFIDKHRNWENSIIGLKFRVLSKSKKKNKYKVELENGDMTFSRRSQILNKRVYPEFISSSTCPDYIGMYESRYILSMYFDYTKDLYFLLTKEHDILLVSRDGELKKIIKHDEE